MRARALIANLPVHIARRELRTAKEVLGEDLEQEVVQLQGSQSPGNTLSIELQSAHITEIFTGFGERGRPAERVAKHAAQEVLRYLEQDAPVGEHLADQLLLPMAITLGGAFKTGPLSSHTTTNIEVIQHFLPVQIRQERLSDDTVVLELIKPTT